MLRRTAIRVGVLSGIVILFANTSSAQYSSGFTVAPGFDPSATLAAAVRFRNFTSAAGESEIWVGRYPLSGPPDSGSAEVAWQTPTSFKITYDLLTGRFKAAQIEQWSGPGVPPAPPAVAEANVGSLGPLNYLEITVRKAVPDAVVYLRGTLNSPLPPDPPPPPPTPGDFGISTTCSSQCPIDFGFMEAPFGQSGVWKWSATGVDFTEGIDLDAALKFGYLLAGGDLDYVEIAVGYVTPPDTQGPTVSDLSIAQPVLLNGLTNVTATLDDSTTGGNAIASVFYVVKWHPDPYSEAGFHGVLAAEDGAFDEAIENVTASFRPTTVGVHELCVRATDSMGNEGTERCQQFLVSYKFTGFDNPIDNALLNAAVAGQSVPTRWRLSDGEDVPIANPDSFRGVFSYPIDCTTLSGDAAIAIEEYSPVGIGLDLLYDGRWQFHWRTPKAYAQSCRAMYVLFDSGATSPVVKFSFK